MLHPIVAQMNPSPEQEPAIRERGRDVVATAGAGTGKTRTLVARYLSLLAEGLPLRSIVAITFTKKAAREMRNRVREEVRKYLERAALSTEKRDRWQALYAALDAARIGTIHSLCAEILRAHPAEAKVDPRFEVLDEGHTNILRDRAVDEALAWAADDQEAVRLFALLGERELRSTIEKLLRQHLDVAQCLDGLPDPLWPEWESILVPPIRAFVDDHWVREAFEALLALRADGTLEHAKAANDRLAAPLRHLLTLWDEILVAHERGDWAVVSARLAPLRGEMKQVGRAANWKPADPKAIIKELQGRYDAGLKEWVGKGINLVLDRQLAEVMPALRRLFEHVVTIYQQLKDDRNALDFDDLEQGALSLLRENDSVRERWQRDVKAVLVDEFQDTNGRQGDLVTLLNGDGGKLFIVGDAKQSIYRFRGADVTVFRTERERIEQEGGAAFRLETSYRAHRDLVQGLNDLLRPVLGELADPERPWAEPFAMLLHDREEPGPGFSPPHVELHLTVGSKGEGALNRAADALAARIVDLMDGGVQVVEDGRKRSGSRPLDYGDVAILCRASTSFSAYEDALERAGVPFLTVAGRGFYGRPEIRDLLNALQALADPTDDLALVGLLRSPAFALSDAALFRLCQERDQAEEAVPLWDVLRETEDGLFEEDGRRADRAIRIITDLHGQAGRTSVADLLKALLDATDYRAGLIRAGLTRAARNVAKLLADAHASGIVGVGEFLEYVNGLRDSGTREGEARATAEGAVQIMSVHAAKGLEFPVVVIGDITHEGRERRDPLIDPDLGVLLPLKDEDDALPAIYRLGKLRDSDQEDAESDRLLYVAATRAREKLIFSGCIRLKRDGTPGSLGGWLGKIGGPEGLGLAGTPIAHDEEGADAIYLELEVGATPVSCTLYEPGYVWAYPPGETRAEVRPSVPLPAPLLDPVSPGIEYVDQRTWEQDRIPPQRVWRVVPAVKRPRAPAWVVGSLVHKALAAWRFPDESFDQWAEARARGCGLTDPRQLANAVSRSRRLLLCFRNHWLFKEMDNADRRLHEVPYSIIIDGHIESGIIDALYSGGQESWRLVEFKTDDLRDENELREGVEKYIPQIRQYARAMESLLGQEPRANLCFLDYKGGVRIEHCNPQGGSGQPLDHSLGEV